MIMREERDSLFSIYIFKAHGQGFARAWASLIKSLGYQQRGKAKKIDCILFMDLLSRLIFQMFSQSSTVSPLNIED